MEQIVKVHYPNMQDSLLREAMKTFYMMRNIEDLRKKPSTSELIDWLRVQVHGQTVEEARAGQRTAVALHGVEREQVERGDWLLAVGSLRPSSILDVRFELLADLEKEWPANTRVRFHLGASEIIGRLVLLEGESVAPGASAWRRCASSGPTVAARGDRFVIRQYSPSHTIGGGNVIEPVAAKRRRHGGALDALEVRESGSLEARLLQLVEAEGSPVSTSRLAQVGGGEPDGRPAPRWRGCSRTTRSRCRCPTAGSR